MTSTDVPTIDRLLGIALDELDEVAALLDRRERKYLVPMEAIDAVLQELSTPVLALEIDRRRWFGYESVYFDTPELRCYLDTARRRPHRFKVRTRTYTDSGTCLLEVKQRDRGRTVKHRHPYTCGDRGRLTPDARAFVSRFDDVAPLTDDLRPALVSTYRRATVVLPDEAARATIDLDLQCVGTDHTSTRLDRHAVVETKSPGSPTALDHLLWRAGHRPAKVSKYGTGMAALHPDLTSNRWHRILDRHLFSPALSDTGVQP